MANKIEEKVELSEIDQLFLTHAQEGSKFSVADYVELHSKQPITVSAQTIRFALLGGDTSHKIDPKGIELEGTHIAGQLDLSNCVDIPAIRFTNCTFDHTPLFRYSKMRSLILRNCDMPGLNLHCAELDGDIDLSGGFTSTSTVWLVCTKVSGSVILAGGTFSPGNHRPDVFSESCTVRAVHLSAAKIGAGLLIAPNGQQFKDDPIFNGGLDLGHTSVDHLVDRVDLYPQRIAISGLRYQQITCPQKSTDNTTDNLSYKERKKWLHKYLSETTKSGKTRLRRRNRNLGPHADLVSYLDKIGRKQDATQLAIDKKHLKNSEAIVVMGIEFPWWINPKRIIYAIFIGLLLGYGRLPHRTVIVAGALLIFSSVFFNAMYADGLLRPKAVKLVEPPTATNEAPIETLVYPAPRFNSIAYSLDSLLPVVSLGQNDFWFIVPDKPFRINFANQYYEVNSVVGEYLRWGLILFGWLITGLLAASLGGIIKT